MLSVNQYLFNFVVVNFVFGVKGKMKIGLFYGTNTGVTEIVAEQLQQEMIDNGFEVDLYDIASTDLKKMDSYETLIIASPTWNDGELQDDWEVVFLDWQQYDFTGKKVGFVGLGDQEAYCDNYLDAIGRLGAYVRENGGTIFGRWSNKGYNFVTSVGDDGDGYFIGLALDNDNQEELTEERIKQWVQQIKNELAA